MILLIKFAIRKINFLLEIYILQFSRKTALVDFSLDDLAATRLRPVSVVNSVQSPAHDCASPLFYQVQGEVIFVRET